MCGREVVPSTRECEGVVLTITRNCLVKRYSLNTTLWIVEPIPKKGYKVLKVEDRVPCVIFAIGMHTFVLLMLDFTSSGRPPHELSAPLVTNHLFRYAWYVNVIALVTDCVHS
jgi:hypothetical protein